MRFVSYWFLLICLFLRTSRASIFPRSFVELPPEIERFGRERATFERSRTLSSLPSSFDWRTRGAVTDVKTQGKCGGCWAFAATGALEGAFFVKNGFLPSLSEQELLDCDGTAQHSSPNAGCGGGNYYYAFQYVSSNHLSSAAMYPYELGQTERLSCRPRTKLVSFPTKDVRFVSRNEDALMAALVEHGPIAVAVSAYTSVFQAYSSGVLRDAAGCGTAVDHALLLVGYDTTPEGVDYWILKNSWGIGWGLDGYVHLERNKNTCGITTQANYVVSPICVNSASCPASHQFCTTSRGCYNATDYVDAFVLPDNRFKRYVAFGESPGFKAAVVALSVTVGFMALVVGVRVRKRRRAVQIRVANSNAVSDRFGMSWTEAAEKAAAIEAVDLVLGKEITETTRKDSEWKSAMETMRSAAGPHASTRALELYLHDANGNVNAALERYFDTTTAHRDANDVAADGYFSEPHRDVDDDVL